MTHIVPHLLEEQEHSHLYVPERKDNPILAFPASGITRRLTVPHNSVQFRRAVGAGSGLLSPELLDPTECFGCQIASFPWKQSIIREYEPQTVMTTSFPKTTTFLSHRREITSSHTNDFVSRLVKFLSWKPGWDGESADPITARVAVAAYVIAKGVWDIAPEPFVAPSPDGSLSLQWEFPDNSSVEIYVEEDDPRLTWAILTDDGVLHERTLETEDALRELLQERADASTAA